MEIIEFLKSISIEVVGALVVFVLGFFISKVPKSIERNKLKKFFGSSVFKDDFQVVYGVIQKSDNFKNMLYEKEYQDGRKYRPRGDYKIIPDGAIRAFAYIVNELSKFRKNPVEICSDEIAYTNLNKTLICIGGPLVNQLTDIAMKEGTNVFFQFSNIESKDVSIDVITDSEDKLSFVRSQGKNYGIIIKIKNSRFKQNYYFVCAGIGIWGTSGAAWYLANNWKDLYKEFKSKEFGIILEVKVKSDTSAVRVYPER